MRSYETTGDTLHAINNPGTAYCPLYASAFTVNSTATSKEEIREADDDEALTVAKNTRLHRFRLKVRPQYLEPTDKFKAVNERWVERGHSPLVVQPHLVEPRDHVCTELSCSGTAESPCADVRNDTDHLGVIAEHLVETFPEAVHLDTDGNPVGVDIAQVATTALAVGGALARKLESAEARIEALEARLQVLEEFIARNPNI
jgi:hypothetical protein